MADQNLNPLPIDPYKHLNITLNPDGSLTRNSPFPSTPPSNPSPNSFKPTQSVTSFDLPLNQSKKTWLRVFLPPNLPPNHKLPLIIYFHGGGFVFYSPSSAPFHHSCSKLCSYLPAVIISVDYRLAPERKLPAAYDDAEEALHWVKDQALNGEYKFIEFVDFSKCYVMGSSSGGNIVYQLGLRVLGLDLGPVKIIGIIMNQPFFGGVKRTESELRFVNDKIVPLVVGDLLWEFALPIGVDKDHEYCNPIGFNREKIGRLPRCFVRGYGGDPLVDKQKEFVKMLEEHGVRVVKHFFDDGFHACELFMPDKAHALLVDVKDFIYGTETTGAGSNAAPNSTL
ncbi:hypothetical protein ACHQM5_000953 [Ranunculus cassubicifolius]